MNNNKGKKRKRIDTGRGQKEQKTIAGGGGKEKIFGYEKAKVEGGRKRLEGEAVCCVAGRR